MAVDGTHLYWTDWGDVPTSGVWRLALSDIGTAAAPEWIADQGWGLTDITVADGRIYWLDGGVYSLTTDLTSPIEIGAGQGAESLVLDDLFIYWTSEETDEVYRARRQGKAA